MEPAPGFYTLIHRRKAGGMDGVEQRAYFTDETSARDSLKEYITEHLYEIFGYTCEITAEGAGGLECNLLEGVRLTADGAVRIDSNGRIEVVDRVRAAGYGACEEYDDWEGDEGDLIAEAAGDALLNLSFLDAFAADWRDDASCVLTNLEYAGMQKPPTFTTLELQVVLPELPRLPGLSPEAEDDEWY